MRPLALLGALAIARFRSTRDGRSTVKSRVDTIRGASAIQLRTAGAVWRDGMTSYRSFVYVQFRMQSDADFESIYFRPHKTNFSEPASATPAGSTR